MPPTCPARPVSRCLRSTRPTAQRSSLRVRACLCAACGSQQAGLTARGAACVVFVCLCRAVACVRLRCGPSGGALPPRTRRAGHAGGELALGQRRGGHACGARVAGSLCAGRPGGGLPLRPPPAHWHLRHSAGAPSPPDTSDSAPAHPLTRSPAPQVACDDGASLAAGLNAACAACVDAGVALSHMIGACVTHACAGAAAGPLQRGLSLLV